MEIRRCRVGFASSSPASSTGDNGTGCSISAPTSGMWDWQSEDCCLGDSNGIEIYKHSMNGMNQNEGHLSYIFDDKTTPLKACGDLAYRETNREVKGTEIEQYKEPSSQVKRRRTLHFESEMLVAPLCNDEMF